MSDVSEKTGLVSEPAEVRFVVEIKRAATGQTDTIEMIGRVAPATEEKKEQ